MNSIRMAGCFDAYDECHRSCGSDEKPLTPSPPPPPPPPPATPKTAPGPVKDDKTTTTITPTPNKSKNQKHKDVTHELDDPLPVPGTKVDQNPVPTKEELEVLEGKKKLPLQQPQQLDDDFEEIGPPPGGEDDEEYDDNESDY